MLLILFSNKIKQPRHKQHAVKNVHKYNYLSNSVAVQWLKDVNLKKKQIVLAVATLETYRTGFSGKSIVKTLEIS
jgi:hypothetical protein